MEARCAPVKLSNREGTLSKPESDEILIRRYVDAVDNNAFVVLMNRHLTFVRRLLAGLLNGNREDMQDVEQEILTALCSDLARFRFDCSFPTYLYRFSKNKAIDYIRKQARHRRVVEAIGQECPDEQETHEEWMRSWELRGEVETLLARLGTEERLLVTLKEMQGLSIAEIAEITNLAQGTVKSRLHRIRRKIANSAAGGER